MSIEIKVPALPESVSEATVADWHKAEGETVQRDENLLDLETDKVMLEVPAEASGILTKLMVQPGDTVSAGDVLGVIEEGEGKAASKSGKGSSDKKSAEKPSAEKPKGGESKDIPQSPAVRRLLDEKNLNADDIPASGKGGRLTKADVEKYLSDKGEEDRKPEPETRREEKISPPEAEADKALPGAPNERIEQRVPMTRIRARIAERLVEAQQTAAMLTTFNEVDLHAVDKLRKQYRELFEKNHNVRLGYMSFFVKAAIEALKRYPVVNASVDGQDIVYHGYYDIGIAASSPRGLVVPILRDVEKMSFGEIESGIGELAQKARNNKLTMDDLLGGTFSITNGGVFGSMMSTPILNPPQSAILGMHAINQRPVVVDGEIVIRPMMYLALSYDHRIIDGREAVLFLRTIKDVLEDPARMLLEI